VNWERIGIESNGYQGVLAEILPEFTVRYCAMRNLPMPHNVDLVCGIHSKHKKEDRIKAALGPRYNRGVIFHAKPFPMLEAQLVDFPYGKHDDHPDCVAMAFSILTPSAIMAAGIEGGLDKNRYDPLPDGELGLPQGFL
jgi:hypothetical protein